MRIFFVSSKVAALTWQPIHELSGFPLGFGLFAPASSLPSKKKARSPAGSFSFPEKCRASPNLSAGRITFTAFLYLVYLVLGLLGWVAWARTMRAQGAAQKRREEAA
jgi:hypothetical protein